MQGTEIAKTLDVREGLVTSVGKAYEKKGIAGIKPQKRGRRKGGQAHEIRSFFADPLTFYAS
jgi:transposase